MRNQIILYLLVAAVYAQDPSEKIDKKVPEVGHHCMECICKASSDCNEKSKCHKDPGAGYLCGPYVVSWAYWHDGGKPGDRGRPQDFETCLKNRTCAEEAVRGYMRRYGQDCDGSGGTDCYDFARIHKLGFGPGCSKDSILESPYWDKFVECYDEKNDFVPTPPPVKVPDDHDPDKDDDADKDEADTPPSPVKVSDEYDTDEDDEDEDEADEHEPVLVTEKLPSGQEYHWFDEWWDGGYL